MTTLTEQHAGLAARHDDVARRLAEVRARYSATAHSALVNNGDRAAQKRALELAREIDAHEAELRAVGAAIEHAEKLAAEERERAAEIERQRAAEERRRALRQAFKDMEGSVALAREIDKLIETLGNAYKRWREQFDQASGAIESLVGSSPSLTGVGRDGLRIEIRNRLCATGVIADQFQLTTELLEKRVSGVAANFAAPFLNAAHAGLNDHSEVSE